MTKYTRAVVYKYDYIQAFGIAMALDLQCYALDRS